MNRLLIDVHVGTLETVNGLFWVAYDENLVEYRTENIPLQLVRVLEFIDDGVCVLRAEPVFKRRFSAAFVKNGAVYRENHIVERLTLHFDFFVLPFFKNDGRLRHQKFINQNLVNRTEIIL